MRFSIALVCFCMSLLGSSHLLAQDLLILHQNKDTIKGKVMYHTPMEVKLLKNSDTLPSIYFHWQIERLIKQGDTIVRYTELVHNLKKNEPYKHNAFLLNFAPVNLAFGTLWLGIEKPFNARNAITIDYAIMGKLGLPNWMPYKNEGFFMRIGIKSSLSKEKISPFLGWYVKPEILYANYFFTREFYHEIKPKPVGNEMKVETQKFEIAYLLGCLNIGKQWRLKGNFLADISAGLALGYVKGEMGVLLQSEIKPVEKDPYNDYNKLIRLNGFSTGLFTQHGLRVAGNFKLAYLIGSNQK